MASTEQPTPAAQMDFRFLTNWCQIKIECPVCQQSFTSFKHSFQSPDDYQVHTPTPPVVPVKRIEST